MAGSTNHMQCHIVNGVVRVHYADGTAETLELVNPETGVRSNRTFMSMVWLSGSNLLVRIVYILNQDWSVIILKKI